MLLLPRMSLRRLNAILAFDEEEVDLKVLDGPADFYLSVEDSAYRTA